MFSMMGISIVGIREVAKNKGNKQNLDRAYSNLFFLNALSTAILLVVLIIAIYAVPKLYEYKELMWIGALKLVSNFLLLEWLYKGLENFKYITVRTIIVKMLYVICVFVFIHDKSDYSIYYLLLSLMVVINAIINVAYAGKFVHLSVKGLNISTYIKPFFILGLYMLLTSMYTSFNVAFLGFSAGETEVGYYTTATKLYSILLALFTAFTGVMLPRMSSLISNQRFDEFKILLRRSFNILMIFAMPLVYFSIVFAPQIISIISGKGYEGAILPMRIVMPLMIIIGYEQILVIQTLMPLKEDKKIFYNSLIGAIVGVCLNFILVPHLKSIGSSIVWFASEITVLCCAQYSVSKCIGFSFPWKAFLKNIIFYLPMLLILLIVYHFIQSTIWSIIAGGVIMAIYCFVLNVLICKNEEVIKIVSVIKAKVS